METESPAGPTFFRRAALRALILLALGVATAVVSNLTASAQRRLAWVGDYPNALILPAKAPAAPVSEPPSGDAPSSAAAGKSFPPHPDQPAVEVSGDDARLLYERKTLFLDARRTKVYEEGHVAGARSFPVWESDIDDRIKALYEEGLDQNAPIVAYCSGGACEDSHMLAQKLYMLGFDNVLVYKDGFPDWQRRGLPIETGPGR